MDSKWAMPHDWQRFWHIGDIEYTQSCAWICLEEVSGRVLTVDVEANDPVCTINSSVLLLANCMMVLVDWHKATRGNVAFADCLLQRLTDDIDGHDADHYWKPYIEYLCEAEQQIEVVTS